MQEQDQSLAARVGQVIDGRWTLERLLGSGGMAAVYGARGTDGTTVAVKILHPELRLKSDVLERFLREASAANRVDHSGAVRVLGQGATGDGVTYLVMELLDGEPLRQRVERHGQLPLPELLDYTDQILDVLAAAHAVGIIHRDLKPDNLFVTLDGRVKVLDFGVARILHDAPSDFKTRTGTALGTLPYMAPEQALGRTAQIDGRTDLFSVGASLFRILSGRRLHEAESEAEMLMAMASKASPPLASVAPDVPPHVCAIVDLALAFSRDARYPDARTMQQDVRAVREGREPPYVIGQRVLAAREEATFVDSGSGSARPQHTAPLAAAAVEQTAPLTVPSAAAAVAAVSTPSGTQPLAQHAPPPPASLPTPPAMAVVDATATMNAPPPGAGVVNLAATLPSGRPPPTLLAETRAAPDRARSAGLVIALVTVIVVLLVGMAVAGWLILRRGSAGDTDGSAADDSAEAAGDVASMADDQPASGAGAEATASGGLATGAAPHGTGPRRPAPNPDEPPIEAGTETPTAGAPVESATPEAPAPPTDQPAPPDSGAAPGEGAAPPAVPTPPPVRVIGPPGGSEGSDEAPREERPSRDRDRPGRGRGRGRDRR